MYVIVPGHALLDEGVNPLARWVPQLKYKIPTLT